MNSMERSSEAFTSPGGQRPKRKTASVEPDYAGRSQMRQASLGNNNSCGHNRYSTPQASAAQLRAASATAASTKKRGTSGLDLSRKRAKTKHRAANRAAEARAEARRAAAEDEAARRVQLMEDQQRLLQRKHYHLEDPHCGQAIVVLALLGVMLGAHREGRSLSLGAAREAAAASLPRDDITAWKVGQTYDLWLRNECTSFDPIRDDERWRRRNVFEQEPDLKRWAIKYLRIHAKRSGGTAPLTAKMFRDACNEKFEQWGIKKPGTNKSLKWSRGGHSECQIPCSTQMLTRRICPKPDMTAS